MIIDAIMLYSHHGKCKTIPLNPDISVITGDVRKGKTTIGDIIDYCFASHECTISKGHVRDRVSAVGLILDRDGDRFAVIRELPPNDEKCYIIQSPEGIPEPGSFGEQVNRKHLSSFLSQKLGIEDKAFDKSGSFEFSVRHAIPMCIQSQSDISNRDEILHGLSSDFFKKRHTRMALPYFLQIYDNHAIDIIREREQIESELIDCRAEMKLNEDLMKKIELRIERLLDDAAAIGLTEGRITKANKESKLKYLSTLEGPFEVHETTSDRLSKLQSDLDQKMEELRRLNNEIKNTGNIVSITKDYIKQKNNQYSRLNCVHLYNPSESDRCPPCGSIPSNNTITIDEINAELKSISDSLSKVKQSEKLVKKFENESSKQRSDLTSHIRYLREEIAKESNAIHDSNRNFSMEVDEIRFRASYLLDTLNELGKKNNKAEIELKKKQIEELDKMLEDDIVQANESEVLGTLANRMTSYGRALEVLNSDQALLFDLKKMMPYTVSNNGKNVVVFNTWGSGYNLTCGHIITILAMHSIFLEKRSSVPSFVFFDQITSATPGETKEDEERRNKTIGFIFSFAKDNPGMQIILSDHLRSDSTLIKGHIVADWWKDDALVPSDWPERDRSEQSE